MISPTIISIDTRNLNRAQEDLLKYSKRTPEVSVATAGFMVARQTAREAHRASVSGIDSQLGVTSTVGLVTRGKRKGLPKKNGALAIQFPRLGGDLTVADKIILARMWPNSKVNQIENWRYALLLPSFYGNKAELMATVRSLAQKMVKGRHKSIAFIASSAGAVWRALEPKIDPRLRSKAVAADPQVESALSDSKTPKGAATVIASGNRAVMTGELLIGMGGTPTNLLERYNEAMFRWLPGPLQHAIDTEAEANMRYVANEELKELEAPLRRSGAIVT